MIQFTSLVPRWIGGTSLSLVVLRSFLLHHMPRLNIGYGTYLCDDDPEEILAGVYSPDTRVYAFSAYMWNLELTLDLCRRLKDRNPHCFALLGGPTASFSADAILSSNPWVDLIVKGEGELPLLELISRMDRGEEDFSDIPNLAYRLDGRRVDTPAIPTILNLEDQHYALDVDMFAGVSTVYYETSRGCVFKCRYCSWNVNQSGIKRIRPYPLEKVMRELRLLFRQEGLEMLLLTDSNILLGGERTKAVFSEINALNQGRRSNGLPMVKINFEFNPEHLTDDLLPEIKKLHVENYPIGLQSVNKEVLTEAGRPFHRDKYLDGLNRLREKAGAAVLVEIIYGLPKDTLEGFRRTLEFVLSELKAELFVCYRYSVLPGSEFWDRKERYGIRHLDAPPYTILSSDSFPEEDLEKAQELVYYLQIIYRVFRSLKKTVENSVEGDKLPVYEAIIRRFSDKYGEILRPKLIYDDGFLDDVARLRSREFSETRRKMLSEAREIVKEYAASREAERKS